MSDRKKFAGFTMIEIAIAMIILAVFLLPLTQHFVRTRRVSLAARDAVIVNSHQTSCIGEFCQLDYRDLSSATGATFTRVLKKYAGKKIINNLDIETRIDINEIVEARMISIDVKSEFRFPGSDDQVRREVCMRGYAFPKP
ncbi:MAG: prepilin-type N-terminal cleavage/methylation domain-containing protein [Candidatus Riflebacteria bacterium]|nr:prepilin-type N-terminal cleavage/methylation domain-containing protein [Candidatus Riflebacteria bacterium]